MAQATLPNAIKALVHNLTENEKPTTYMRGKVTSVSPLTIRVEGHLELTSNFLLLTHLVKDHEVDITVSHTTENRSGGTGDALFQSHNHDYKGRKKIIIHNGLQVGEEVLLIRQAGGQEYIVLDRISPHICSGQWG